MTIIKQDLEIEGIATAINAHLPTLGLPTIKINAGFIIDDPIVPPLLSLYFLPNGPEPFQLGNTSEKLYKRVLQIDMYMESRTKANTLIDVLMDFLDTMVVLIKDPLQNDLIIGSVTCQNTDSIYGQIVTPNIEKAKVIKWRGIIRGTLDAHYPNG
jgi:hypothetical protein